MRPRRRERGRLPVTAAAAHGVAHEVSVTPPARGRQRAVVTGSRYDRPRRERAVAGARPVSVPMPASPPGRAAGHGRTTPPASRARGRRPCGVVAVRQEHPGGPGVTRDTAPGDDGGSRRGSRTGPRGSPEHGTRGPGPRPRGRRHHGTRRHLHQRQHPHAGSAAPRGGRPGGARGARGERGRRTSRGRLLAGGGPARGHRGPGLPRRPLPPERPRRVPAAGGPAAGHGGHDGRAARRRGCGRAGGRAR